MTEQEVLKKIHYYMEKIEHCLSEIPKESSEDNSIIYSALCNCTMQWLTKAENYKDILDLTISQFRSFEKEVDKQRNPNDVV